MLGLVVAFGATGCSAPYSFSPSAETGAYRIAGHIVSSVDGHPLAHATVEIASTPNVRPVASISSDEAGAFSFADVPAGSFVLHGSNPRYLSSRYDQHGTLSTAIVTGAGVDTESLMLKLTPSAELHGRITDESGDPVNRANLTLYREEHGVEGVRVQRVRNAQSDDTGDYSFGNLAPGRYFLSALGRPWYATYPQPDQPGNFAGIVESIDPALNVAYPLTFYPRATDSAGAEPIVLRGAGQARIDLRLNPQPALSLAIPIPKAQGNQNRGIGPLMRTVFGASEWVGQEMRSSNSEYVFVGLTAGQYLVNQPGNAGGGRSATVDLGSQSVRLDPGWGAELSSVKVQLKAAGDAPLPAQMQVRLVRDQPSAQTINMPGGPGKPGGEIQLNGIPAGEYRFEVNAGQRQFYVSQISVDGRKAQPNKLHVAAGAALPVSVSVAAVSASVQGFARRDGKPAPGVLILMVPAGETPGSSNTRTDQSDLDGSFHLASLAPGSYTLLALADAWDLALDRKEVLARYLPSATSVTVTEKAGAIQLESPVEVIPR